jgi:hypothetical protein
MSTRDDVALMFTPIPVAWPLPQKAFGNGTHVHWPSGAVMGDPSTSPLDDELDDADELDDDELLEVLVVDGEPLDDEPVEELDVEPCDDDEPGEPPVLVLFETLLEQARRAPIPSAKTIRRRMRGCNTRRLFEALAALVQTPD